MSKVTCTRRVEWRKSKGRFIAVRMAQGISERVIFTWQTSSRGTSLLLNNPCDCLLWQTMLTAHAECMGWWMQLANACRMRVIYNPFWRKCHSGLDPELDYCSLIYLFTKCVSVTSTQIHCSFLNFKNSLVHKLLHQSTGLNSSDYLHY